MSRVARFHADRTNQKLYFARLACQQAEGETNVQAAQGAREAAVFHLYGVVQAYLQELGRYYRLNDLMRPLPITLEAAGAARTEIPGTGAAAAGAGPGRCAQWAGAGLAGLSVCPGTSRPGA